MAVIKLVEEVLAKLEAFRKETGKCLVIVYQRELERRTYS